MLWGEVGAGCVFPWFRGVSARFRDFSPLNLFPPLNQIIITLWAPKLSSPRKPIGVARSNNRRTVVWVFPSHETELLGAKDDVIGRVAESVWRSFGDTAAANKSRCALDRCAKNQFAALRSFLESARGGSAPFLKFSKYPCVTSPLFPVYVFVAIADMDFDDDSSSEMQFDEDSSSEMEFEEDAEHFYVNDSNVHFVVRPFDDAAEKAELILNNTLTQMKKQDKGPTTESETAYLVTLKSNLIELIRPGYDLVFAKCTREILVVMCTYRNRWKVQLQNPLDVIKCKFLEGTTKD